MNAGIRIGCLSMLMALAIVPAALAQGKGVIVPADAKLEKVFDGGVVLTEGVTSAPDGMIYFSDITFSHVSRDKKGVIEAGHIWKFDPQTKKTEELAGPCKTVEKPNVNMEEEAVEFARIINEKDTKAASKLEEAELNSMGLRGETWFQMHFQRDKLLSRLEAELEEVAQ